MTDDIDEIAAKLASTGWAGKPKGLGFSPEEQAMADALLGDWRKPAEPASLTFEWLWVTNTLGRRWQVAKLIDGRRFLASRGFTNEGLQRYLKSLRSEGHVVREAGAPSRSAAA